MIISHEYVWLNLKRAVYGRGCGVLPRARDSVGPHGSVGEWLAWSCEGMSVEDDMELGLGERVEVRVDSDHKITMSLHLSLF